MKVKFLRVAVASLIFVILLTQIFTAESIPPTHTIAVNVGDTFNFVLHEYINEDFPLYSVAIDKFTGVELFASVGSEYQIKIINTTISENPVSNMDSIEIELSNGTYSVISDNPLVPSNFYVSYSDFDFWYTNMTADPLAFWGPDFRNQTITNGAKEFSINVFLNFIPTNSTFVYLNTQLRYNKTDGVVNMGRFQTYNFELLNSSNWLTHFSRRGYVQPEEPVTNSTITSTSTSSSSTVTSTTSTGTATTTTSTVTTTTSSDTVTTTTVITTTSSVTSSSETSSTITSTSDTVTTTVSTSDTATSSTTTRDLATTTSDSTLDRNTTSDSNDTPVSPSDDDTSSPTATLPVPGFGSVFTFTALLTIITIIRYKKH